MHLTGKKCANNGHSGISILSANFNGTNPAGYFTLYVADVIGDSRDDAVKVLNAATNVMFVDLAKSN